MSLSVEGIILGLMLRDEENVHACISAGLSISHFWDDVNRGIFSEIIRKMAANQPIGMIDIAMSLTDSAPLIIEYCEQAPISQNIEYYIGEIKWAKRARSVKDAARQLMNCETRGNFDQATLNLADALQTETDAGGGPLEPSVWLKSTVEYMEDAHARNASGRKVGLQTGIEAFDSCTGGLRPKALYVIGARPGCGKTTLGLNFALATAMSGSKPIYFTNEMDEAQLGTKLVSNLSRVDSYRIDAGDFNEEHIDRIHYATEQLSRTSLCIDSTTRGDFGVLRARVERAHRRGQCDSVYIDYIQQYSIPGRWNTRAQELEEICRRAKDMGMVLGIPVVIMAQINRGGDDDPRLKDLKDSGGIEQYADVIVLLSRDKDSRENDNPVRLNCTIGKNRYGSTRRVWVRADLSTSRFLPN